MLKIAQEINMITAEEKSFLAFSIQDSFFNYDKDFSVSQKNDLDKRCLEHTKKIDNAIPFKSFFSGLVKKYAK